MGRRLTGFFTRDERAVVAFVTITLAAGSLLLAARRVSPVLGPREERADTCTVAAPDVAAPGPLDLNRATAADLLSLPGIGPTKAAAIVELRESRGRLSSVEELLDAKGIGPRTLEKLRPLVVVGERKARDPRDGGRAEPDTGASGGEGAEAGAARGEGPPGLGQPDRSEEARG